MKNKFIFIRLSQQRRFIRQWLMLDEYGTSPQDVFENIASNGSILDKKIAKQCLIALDSSFGVEGMQGYFPEVIINSIRISENQGDRQKGLQVALKMLDDDINVTSKFLFLSVYPITIFTGFALFAANVVQQMAKDLNVNPDFAIFITNTLPAISTILLILIVLIATSFSKSFGATRDFLDNFPIYKQYKYSIATSLLSSLGNLGTLGLNITDSLDELYKGASPYLRYHIIKMREKIDGGEQNLGKILDTNLLLSSEKYMLKIVGNARDYGAILLTSSDNHFNHVQQTSKFTTTTVNILTPLLTGLFLILTVATVIVEVI